MKQDALAHEDPEVVIAALAPLVGPERAARIDAVAAGRLGGVVVVLENLYDPHNGGAALRSCEAVGVLEVCFIGPGGARYSDRVTQGCEKWLETRHFADVGACVADLRTRGFRLYAGVAPRVLDRRTPPAERKAAPPPLPDEVLALEELDARVPAAFFIGNEHAGLSPEARAACDATFTIPLHGFSESVNLSVATALIVYTHTTRRRAALGASGDLDDAARARLRAHYYARDLRGAAAVVARYRADHGL